MRHDLKRLNKEEEEEEKKRTKRIEILLSQNDKQK
jgi:hypothetical protein